jgi:hypothetical protein
MPAQTTPYEKRIQASDIRLRDALERLVQDRPIHPRHQNGYRLTVAVLAREAGVGRNAIYTNHRSFLDALQVAATTSAPKPPANWQDKVDELRAIITTMKQEERRMITENAVLLQRGRAAEADAERSRRQYARLVAERDAALRPIAITTRPRRTASDDQQGKGPEISSDDLTQDS